MPLVLVGVLALGEVAVDLADPRGPSLAGDRRWRSNTYASQDDSRRAFVDARELTIVPAMYLGYTLAPDQHRPTLNVSSRGMRGPESGPAARTVIVLGGSTVFGFGATGDDRTTPAVLGSMLRSTRPDVRVLNLGVPGYVSTQELLDLQLRGTGQQPDVVVLLDGFNDAYVARLHATAGAPFPYEFGNWSTVVRDALLNAHLGEIAIGWARELRLRPLDADPGSRAERIRAIADTYELRIRSAAAIATAAGARFVHFLQPSLVAGAKALSTEERALLSRVDGCWDIDVGQCLVGTSDFLRDTYAELRAVSARLRSGGIASVDLTGVFDGVTETRWIDLVHLGDRGYADVATAMFPHVREALQR